MLLELNALPITKDYIMLTYNLQRISPKCQNSPGLFPEAVVQRFSLKEMFLRISQNPQEIQSTGVFS